MKFFPVLLGSYLIGSIPFSYLFPKLKGHDPRGGGTGNVGATNSLIVAGPLAGVLALIGDIAKGFLAVQLARYFNFSDAGIALCGLAVILGHDFSVFLRFSGGKGVAATTGVMLALNPFFTLILILLWALCLIIFRRFIPSTVAVLCFMPLLMWLTSWRAEFIAFGAAAALLSVYTHRLDLQRFLRGEELTIQQSFAKYLKK
ncbi:glycerol-3-phosphate acyltransferase [Candidatus Saganbacteria bacterium]|uniref:Glycerol-3-phosphate acyltransferase n=1 Tax=Candidatus Saganbacteria bacterium TaxID=2575572 RepID=A0A9D6YV82_UNCSA|nr:glycerol-3-phosphate acyltransferase [Candidatus Saganbacteria bacterium]